MCEPGCGDRGESLRRRLRDQGYGGGWTAFSIGDRAPPAQLCNSTPESAVWKHVSHGQTLPPGVPRRRCPGSPAPVNPVSRSQRLTPSELWGTDSVELGLSRSPSDEPPPSRKLLSWAAWIVLRTMCEARCLRLSSVTVRAGATPAMCQGGRLSGRREPATMGVPLGVT